MNYMIICNENILKVSESLDVNDIPEYHPFAERYARDHGQRTPRTVEKGIVYFCERSSALSINQIGS